MQLRPRGQQQWILEQDKLKFLWWLDLFIFIILFPLIGDQICHQSICNKMNINPLQDWFRSTVAVVNQFNELMAANQNKFCELYNNLNHKNHYKVITTKLNQMKKDDEQISYATNKKGLQKSKIVFVGDQYVGKTSIITRFIKNSFDGERNPTIGIDFVSKNICLGGKQMRLQLWDTAGQERFRSLIPNYIRDCQAALIIFDLTNEESFENVPKWIDFIKQHRGDDATIMVIGNKLDLKPDRKVDHDTANQKFADMGIKYSEVSAKSGENVEKMFQELCADLLNLSSDTSLPPLEIQQSKLVTNVNLQKESPIKKQKQKNASKQPKNDKINQSTKLTKKSVQEQRRVKQKQCC